ncbi:hypothetical protein [Muricoccus radiodurans]|uniref:hypothetical protein n=1 Tax=Muricoccus radiodurans TaxID=2231721 RepID=UPI003CF211C4
MILARSGWGLLAALALLGPVRAERLGVRLGDHPGFGRVVVDLTDPSRVPQIRQQGGEVVLRLGPGTEFDIPASRPLPRNVQALRAEDGALRIGTRPGARLRQQRLEGRVVLDVLDPPASPSPQAAAPAAPVQDAPQSGAAGNEPARTAAMALPAPATGRRGRSVAIPATAPEGLAPGAAPATGGVGGAAPSAMPSQNQRAQARGRRGRPEPATAAAPPTPPPPIAVPAAPPLAPAVETPPPPPVPAGPTVRVVRGEGNPALLLPLPDEAGMAVLRRGETILVVTDQGGPLDLSALRDDPVFGAADLVPTPDATVLRLRLAAPTVLRARRDRHGWRLEAARDTAPERSVTAEAEGGRLLLRAGALGRPVPVLDPETGLPILVGTTREAAFSVPAGWRLPAAEMLPTMLGVAVLARADTASLRRAGDRLALSGVGNPGAAGRDLAALPMTRLFDFPALDAGAAQERLRQQGAGIAAAPPLTRLPLRREAAEGLLALGLAQEAQAMTRLALQEDPRAGTDPRLAAAHAAAALLAGRSGEAGALIDGSLPVTDETALWGALVRVERGEVAAAAPAVASTLPLLLSYPSALRERLMPLAAEALLAGNERGALRRLLAAAGDSPAMGYARARLAEADGRTDDALALLAGLAEGRDRLVRARALRRSVDLRVASGAMDAAAGAAALEAALFAWRGDAEELDARLRLATLKREAGDARGALSLLRETAALFPDRAAAMRAAQEEALLGVLAREPPLVAVAMAEVHAELLPRDTRGTEALGLLADRLVALDLPARAVPLARQALERAPAEQRPAAGARLASVLLATGDSRGASAVLEETGGAALPAVLAAERALLSARALAGRGEGETAVALLRGMGEAGLGPLAELLAARQDWTGAADALAAKAALTPETPALQRDAVRAAAFAALAGDPARLAALRATWSERLAGGPLGAALDLITADPVRGLSDLPRLGRELDLFRGFPVGLEAFRTAAASSR